MSQFSEIDVRQMMNALRSADFTTADMTTLKQPIMLADVLLVLHGKAEIVSLEEEYFRRIYETEDIYIGVATKKMHLCIRELVKGGIFSEMFESFGDPTPLCLTKTQNERFFLEHPDKFHVGATRGTFSLYTEGDKPVKKDKSNLGVHYTYFDDRGRPHVSERDFLHDKTYWRKKKHAYRFVSPLI